MKGTGGDRADLELAIDAALVAGVAVMRSFGRPQEVVEKAPDQPLTEADLEADRLLGEKLLAERSGYGWLSEETMDRPDRLAASRVWIVDPIDGTRSYIAGRPEFAISIGLAERGVAVVGVVYNPATAELFWAVRGGGAYLTRARDRDRASTMPATWWIESAQRLAVTDRSLDDQMVLFASRSEIAAGEFDPFHGGWRIEPVGSTAYKLARIAAGDGDVFLSRGPKSEWDICAGALLVEEAGGRVTDLEGRTVDYNRPDPRVYGVLASNGGLHDYMLGVVATLPPPPRLLREARDPLHPGLKEGR